MSRFRSWWGSRVARLSPAGLFWRGRRGCEGRKASPGGSILAGPRGDLLVQAPVFQEAIVPATIDFEEITRARADLPLLADLEMRLPHLLGSLHAARREKQGRVTAGQQGSAKVPRAEATSPGSAAPLPPLPARFRPGQDPLAIDPELTRHWLVEFIR